MVNNSFINCKVKKLESRAKNRKRTASTERITSSNSSITSVKAKLVCLLKSHPDGIYLDGLVEKFELKYRKRLSPEQFNCTSIPQLLRNFNDVIDIELCSSIHKVKVVLKGNCISPENDEHFRNVNKKQELINAKVFSEVRALKEESIKRSSEGKLVNIFKAILDSYGGMCVIDHLPGEYENRTDSKLDVKEYGCSSLLQLIFSLGDEFQIKVQKNGQSILILTGDPILEDKIRAMDLTESCNKKGKLKKETKDRVRKLLTEFYPDGLTEGEINGAYKGLFGHYLEDFEPATYDYTTIPEMLEDETEVVKVVYRKNCMYYVSPNTYETLSEMTFGDKEEKLLRNQMDDGLPNEVVKAHETFQPLILSKLVKVGHVIDVIGGDCYSAERFYIQLHAKNYSSSLDTMVNNMCAFYHSEMKERYHVPDDFCVARYPMAIYYPKDECYYRGVIHSWEDLENMKVYLVDYGTEYCTTKENVFLLHREFFTLPPQAVKAQLFGLKPPDSRDYFLRCYSELFLKMIVDQIFALLIHKIENNSLFVTAYRVPQEFKDNGGLKETVRTIENTTNINRYLVDKGCALFKNTQEYNVELSKLEKDVQKRKATRERRLAGVIALDVKNEENVPKKVVALAADALEEVVAQPPKLKAESLTTSLEKILAATSSDEELSSNTSNSQSSNDYCNDGKINTDFRKLAKTCMSYDMMNDSADTQSRDQMKLMAARFTDIPSCFQTPLSTSGSGSSITKSNSCNLDRLPYDFAIPSSDYKVLDTACGLKQMSGYSDQFPLSPKESKGGASPRTSSRITMLDSNNLFTRDKTTISSEDASFTDCEGLNFVTERAEKCSMDIKCEVRQIAISPTSKIRVIRNDDQWYMAVDELPYLILEAEHLRTVIEVIEVPTLNRNEITLATNPDIFLLLVRNGAEYIFTENNKILTKLQIINFDVVLAIMEEIYPKKYQLLEILKNAKEQFSATASSIQKKLFKLRDICGHDDSISMSNISSMSENHFMDNSHVAPIHINTSHFLPESLNSFPRPMQTQSAPNPDWNMHMLQLKGNFPEFSPPIQPALPTYPVVRQPPGFNSALYGPRFQNMQYQMPNSVYPYMPPLQFSRHPTTPQMPNNQMCQPGYY